MNEHRTTQWIVGVDGSPGSEQAVRWGAAHAPGRTPILHLVRAWQLPAVADADFGAQVAPGLEPKTAYETLDELADELAPANVTVKSTVVFGGASSKLLSAAEHADLLVLGTRGFGGFRRLLLGSVSHQCATHASVPVVVVPGDVRIDGELRHVVVGVDGSLASAAALDWALSFAPHEATVRAIGVWTPSRWATDADVALFDDQSRRQRDDYDRMIDEVEARLGRPGATTRDFEYGNPAEVLLGAGTNADLLVVGERGHGGLSGTMLGSVTTDVLHHATCATAVIPVP